ncbi:hypothetical protein F5X99DRAFT_12779, partial [Biscogniauxia marginata]
SLYCCDSNCGVWIDRSGQSPNVDLIINRCQNNGYYSIPDPGPPPSWDSCLSDAPGDAQPALPTGTIEPQDTGLRTFSRLPVPSTKTAPASPLSTYAPSPDSPRPSSSTTSPFPSSETASAGLTAGSKAAIGICTSLGVIALVFLLIFMIRRRRSDPRTYPRSDPTVTRHKRSFSEPPSGSRTSLTAPLMTPTSASLRNTPCTPPARLSDRKYLTSVFNQGLQRPPSTPSGAEKPAFPVSPIFAPTSSKLVPRHERRATTNSSIRSPLPSPPPASSQYPRSSIYSLSSGLGASTTTFNSNKGDSVRSGTVTVTGTSTPPLSPTRPPRPHDGPLQIPDLVAPSGPPPSHALPPPPPSPAHHKHPICSSPTFPVSPVSPASPTFPARPIVLGGSPVVAVYQHADKVHYEPAIGIAVPHSPPPPPPPPPLLPPPAVAVTSAAAKELCDLTESYARERKTRDSWGSWSGAGYGGGGPGVSPIGAGRKRGSDGSSRGSADKKGSANATGTALRELDLEKLGGRY